MTKFFVNAFSDVLKEELKANELNLAPSKLTLDGKLFKPDENTPLDKSLQNSILSGKLVVEHTTKQEWIKFFEKFLKDGDDVVFFSVSLKLYSDDGQDILDAFSHLSENYPGRKAILIDTKTISRGTLSIAKLALTVFKTTNDLDKTIDFANKISGQFVTAFVSDDVKFLISNPVMKKVASSLAGGMINVKPIISLDKRGHFKLLDKARGFKTGVNKLFSITNTNGENIADFTFSIIHSNAEADALALKQKFMEFVDETEISVNQTSIGNMCFAGTKFVGIIFHSK